jgi:hypothetical protein
MFSKDEWLELLEKAAGSYYFEAYASKVATQGNASVQEGHFSFTSLRTQAKDLKEDFLQEAARMKPTAPGRLNPNRPAATPRRAARARSRTAVDDSASPNCCARMARFTFN